jgi:flagellin-specific chaperone FliS
LAVTYTNTSFYTRIGQMLAGLNADVAPDLVRQVAAVYVFVFRSLVEAHLARDEKKLADALRVGGG